MWRHTGVGEAQTHYSAKQIVKIKNLIILEITQQKY